MIIVKLSGGLGNQMFQYAAGLSVAKNNNTKLFLDVDFFKKNTAHNGFELSKIFSEKFHISTVKDVRHILGFRSYSILFKILLRVKNNLLRGQNLYIEPHFSYDRNFKKICDNNFLVGYFQSEKYFIDIENLIRKIFTFNKNLNTKNKEFLKLIKNSNSVSIHIRRGDYLSNQKAFDVHGICSDIYYDKAISYIRKKISNPKFYIFSDDKEWVKHKFNYQKNFIVVDSNSASQSYFDMFLMSKCKHNIIANSSFSWWAAWLNNNPSKNVIAPKMWFKSKSLSTKDLIPKNWILING
jgi:hypothetical protein